MTATSTDPLAELTVAAIRTAKGETTPDSTDKILAGAIKYDGNKTPIFQGVLSYFPRALSAVADVSAFGARKYAWKGWEGVEDGVNRYSNSLGRHFVSEGFETVDPDSGLTHAAHVAWNALARLELMIRENKTN